MRLVDAAATLSAEMDRQFLPALVRLGVLLDRASAGCDLQPVAWDEYVHGVGAAAEFAAGEAVACCL